MFPTKKNQTYFNNGTLGVQPNYVLNSVIKDMQNNAINGAETDYKGNGPNLLSGYADFISIREKIGKIINCDYEEISLIQNATFGMNFVANGLDLKKAYDGIKISSGNSFVHETESQVILNGSYDVGFTMDLVCKDLRLFDKLVDKYNIPAKISKLMNKIFAEGKIQFGDRSLSTSIVKRLEELCNENLRAPGFPSQLTDEEPKKKGIEINFD